MEHVAFAHDKPPPGKHEYEQIDLDDKKKRKKKLMRTEISPNHDITIIKIER